MKKKFAEIIFVVILVLFSASFVFATDDIDIGIKNTNDAHATGGAADAKASVGNITNTNTNSNANSNVNGNNNVNANRAGAKSVLVNNEAPNFVTAPLLSAFVNAPTSEVPKGWKPLFCDPSYQEFTIGQLKSMINGGSIFNKRGNGLKVFFLSRVITSVRFKTERELNDETIIRIINRNLGFGKGKLSGSSEGRGDHDSPVDQIFAETVLDLVQKTGSTSVLVDWDIIMERTSSSSSLGVGFTASHTDGSAASGSIGASSGDSSTLTRVTYMIDAKSYENVDERSFSCEPAPVIIKEPAPPIVIPEPQVKKSCNPDKILKRIEQYKKAAKHCTKNCFNNSMLWKAIGDDYMRLFDCTGNRDYLLAANAAYERSEKNVLTGKEPDGTLTRNVEGADNTIYSVRYNWSLVVLLLNGEDAQTNFANAKGLSAVPETIDELK